MVLEIDLKAVASTPTLAGTNKTSGNRFPQQWCDSLRQPPNQSMIAGECPVVVVTSPVGLVYLRDLVSQFLCVHDSIRFVFFEACLLSM